MISTNTVRNLVLFILEKENRGTISPPAYDSFGNMAQLEIFEQLFYDLNDWLVKQNKRLTNNEFANIPKNIREQIDVFTEYSTPLNFTYNSTTNLWSYTGTNLYRTVGLSLVNLANKKIDIEEVSKSELNMLNNSNMVAPTLTYPAYVKLGDSYRVYPNLLPENYKVELLFIRTPKPPKWTFVNDGGNPLYNASASDLQNFELMPSLLPKLVTKILLYCGISLREADVVQIASQEEIKKIQTQN
jgi:hypothetical protein